MDPKPFISLGRSFGVSIGLVALVLCSCLGVVAQQPPNQWISRGAGGGGALFSPSINPLNPNEVYAASDLSALYRTSNYGLRWDLVDFHQIQSFHESKLEFTSDSMIRYTINFASDARTPVKSTDGGGTWTALAGDPTGAEAYSLFADRSSTNRLIVTDYTTIYLSTNGGTSFTAKFTSNVRGAGCHVGGVFWDGNNIYVGTSAGLLVSTNGGNSFSIQSTGGIPAGEVIVSFSGGKQGTTTRLQCITYPVDDVFPAVTPIGIESNFQGLYTLDVGQANWTSRTSAIPAGVYPYFVAMADNNINIAYVSGASDKFTPTIYKTTNGGATWSSVFQTTNNQNIVTGWAGDQGDRSWEFGEYALGFNVCPSDPNRVILTDFGHPHLSSDGGTTWKQAYVDPATQNPAGSVTPKGSHYLGIGMEQTSTWWLAWANANTMFAAFTDIRGKRSTDGGTKWSFGYTGHTLNSMYEVIRHPGTGWLFGATSSVHDMYQSTYLTDALIDRGTGQVLFSSDQGVTWQVSYAAGRPVICLASDPTNPNRMYASVIHSTEGGIFVSNNVNAGTGATWTKLTNPPRTQGHPFNIRVLNDGSVVCSYSGRRAGSPLTFQNSSGVFYSTDGGGTWADRTGPSMIYWTKDVVIDPHDASQNTWYVGVWNGYGSAPSAGLPPPQGTGGLYKTSDRGQTWTRILNPDSVTSCTISPTNGNEMYVTTEHNGLLYTTNLNSGTPTFSNLSSFKFRQPERVFYNPFDTNQIWVTTFGSGLHVGTLKAGNTQPTINAVGVTRQAGSLVSNTTIANVNDLEDSENTLAISVNGGRTATANGVTVSGISVSAAGDITADVVASCTASATATFLLTVTDSGNLTNQATLTVTVTSNPPPILRYPEAVTRLVVQGEAVINPTLGPNDNGTVTSLVLQGQVGFTGTVQVNSRGVVTISNAGPLGGPFTIIIRATDNCGSSTDASFQVSVQGGNTQPTITPVGVTQQEGGPVLNSTIANVNDVEDAETNLAVMVNGGATATVNGVTVSGIRVSPAGMVTANVAAACNATTAQFTLTVTDSSSLTNQATLTVTVNANVGPALTYPAKVIKLKAGAGTTVNPASGPTDSGGVSSVVVQGQGGFTGKVLVNEAGVVTISNAGPVGGPFIITIRATDNCGSFTDATFQVRSKR
ncbi:MAG: hypothetical protein K1Y36_25510 [Blastocatellia bacterium]|nr:hypothetical protein [Blastocatellia bacterium]